MGHDSADSFGLKESYILMRGMLPEVSVNASENEMRHYIRDSSEKVLGRLSINDFEFLEACGKRLCVPAHQADFEWTGRAVKQLAGTGAIYVRLTRAREEDDWSDDSSLANSEPDVKVVKVGELC